MSCSHSGCRTRESVCSTWRSACSNRPKTCHGVIIASIRSVIANYHGGDAYGAGQTLNQLKPRYDRLRALTDSDCPPGARSSTGRAPTPRMPQPTVPGTDGYPDWRPASHHPEQRLEPREPAAELDLSRAANRGPITRVWRIAKAAICGIRAWIRITHRGGCFGGRAALSGFGWYPPAIVGWTVGLLGVRRVRRGGYAHGGLASPLMNLIGAQVRLVTVVDPIAPSDRTLDRADVWVYVQI